MVIGALTFYWNTGVVAPLDFRCMIIRFIALFQGHITYQPKVTRAFANLRFVIYHPYNFTA